MDDLSVHIRAKPWGKLKPPRRILAIRLHALGDVVITLPYLQELRNKLPRETRIDLVTLQECGSIPRNLTIFDYVYELKGGRNFKKQLFFATMLLPRLFLNRYEVILDLQDAIISRLYKKILFPAAWSLFDRFSPVPAGVRTQRTMEAIGLGKISPGAKFSLRSDLGVEELLKRNGCLDKKDLILLNPAGAFETRNWPIENYRHFSELWLREFPDTQFLVLGIGSIAEKANQLKNELSSRLINLVNKTDPAQAFAIVQRAKLILTEDSGLMHMCWVSGVPTLALFGSTRAYHARPLGEKSFLFDSSDLPCGNCMRKTCIYGDNRCLTRHSPEIVFAKAKELIGR